jgi:uncharacterized membrane protein
MKKYSSERCETLEAIIGQITIDFHVVFLLKLSLLTIIAFIKRRRENNRILSCKLGLIQKSTNQQAQNKWQLFLHTTCLV